MIVLKAGSSSNIEDADMIVLWDYWSPGKIIDTYYDVLKDKDVKYIDELPNATETDEMGNIDPVKEFQFVDAKDSFIGDGILVDNALSSNGVFFDNHFTDGNGNIRVIRVYWKSFRKIQKVKSYNLETGEEEFNFYPEDYVIDKNMGEESTIL